MHNIMYSEKSYVILLGKKMAIPFFESWQGQFLGPTNGSSVFFSQLCGMKITEGYYWLVV